MKVAKGVFGRSNKHDLPIEDTMNNSQNRNLRAEKRFKLSQTESLESNYSRITSLFGFGSRQSSQETNCSGVDEFGPRKVALVKEISNKWRQSQSTEETGETRDNKEECSDYSRREAKSYLILRRADAIDEVSPSLERWTLPEIVVHRAEELPSSAL